MIRHIYGLVYTIFVVFLTQHLGNVFCKKRDNNIWQKALMFIEWTALLFFFSYAVKTVALRLPVNVLIGAVYILLLYKTSAIKALLIELFSAFISIVTDTIMFFVSRLWEPMQNVNAVFDNTISYYSGISSLIIQLLLLLLIERAFDKVDGKKLPANLWTKYLLFPLFSLFIIGVILFSIDSNLSEMMGTAIVVLAIGLAIMNIYVFYFLRNDIRNQLEAERIGMIYHNADELQKMYRKLNDERDRLGKENHEFKNMVSVWSRLLKNKDYAKLTESMDNAYSIDSMHSNVYYTGNDTVDIILNDKFFEAAGKGINFVVDINDLTSISINDEDIIILLSNVLSNAIEACDGIERPVIFIKIVMKYGAFILSVKNTVGKAVNAEMRTTKKDKLRHGYGISNIKSVVEKYNGSYRTELENDMFATYIVLPQAGE